MRSVLLIFVLRIAKALVDVVLQKPIFFIAFNGAQIHPVVANTVIVADLRLLSVLLFTPTFTFIVSVA